jgi:hypothetical protein
VPQPDGVHAVTTEEELRTVERLRYELRPPDADLVFCACMAHLVRTYRRTWR